MLATLFIHCTLGHGGMWRGVVAGLPGLSAVTVDLPDHGRAPPRDPARDLHDQSTDLARAALPAGPVAAVGHSFGGTVALRLAIEGRLRALVLIEPMLMALARSSDPDAYRANATEFKAILTALAQGKADRAADLFLAIWGQGGRWADLPPRQQAQMARQMSFVAATRPVVEEDSPGLIRPGVLETLDIPVLLIEGDRSPPVVAAIQTELARRLPRATRVVLRGAGHMAPLTHPQAVAQAIRDWGGLAVEQGQELIHPVRRH